MNKKLGCFAVIAAGALCAQESPAGQRQESLKGVVRKNLAPVSKDVLRVKLPKGVDRKLKNGLSVLVLENRRVPTVSLDLVLPASTLSDPKDLPGVAEATADMLKQGTKTRNSRQIAEEISELGAGIGVFAEYGSRATHLSASTLTENLDKLLELMADVLLNPTFPQDELDKWKQRKLTSFQMMRSEPYFLASERLFKVLYPGDPRAVNSATPESVKKITREDLIDYYKTYYRPQNSLMGVTGDITPDAIAAKLNQRLVNWETASATAPKLPMLAPIAEKKIYLVNRPNSVQTLLILANRAIDRLNPDYEACMVMNQILGSGPASRLFRNIREDKGFTYGVYSGFAALKYIHHFQAAASVRTEVTGPAIDEFLNEFHAIREKPVPQEELDKAKRAIVASFALSIEYQGGVLRQLLLAREYGLPDDYWNKYPDRIMAVTAADVQRVAQKYVPLDNLQLIAVGDAGKIREVLRKYGPVEEYTAEGKKAE